MDFSVEKTKQLISGVLMRNSSMSDISVLLEHMWQGGILTFSDLNSSPSLTEQRFLPSVMNFLPSDR